MAGSFLDTTIVIHVADNVEPQKSNGEVFIGANQPTTAPYYALRELLAGHVRILCDAHNILNATDNPAEATIAILNRSPAEGRKREAKARSLNKAVDAVYAAKPMMPLKDSKREVLQELALQANNIWRKSQKLRGVSLVQPLACFNKGKISHGPTGELRGPKDSFNCIKDERCAAAAYLYDNQSDLKKMIDALHPAKLEPKIAAKGETRQRRRALKELLSNGPINFHKSQCRALGDAYFAGMCPPGSVIATSNLEDFLPLCSALNKKMIVP